MRRSIFRLFVGLALFATSVAAEAAIEASSYLNINSYVVTNVATGLPVTAAAAPGPGVDVVVTGTSQSSVTTAQLNLGPTDINFSATVDALVASSDGTAVPPLGPAFENMFGPGPALALGTRPLTGPALPYARADTNGFGTIATLLPGPVTTGATAQTISDVLIPGPLVDTGLSSATITSSTVFLRVISPLTVTLDFLGYLDLTLDYTSPPPTGLALSASASFETLIVGTGITVGGSTSGSFSFAPAALNTGLVTNSTPGSIVGGHPGGPNTAYSSPLITLAPGTYSVTLTQGTTASISQVIPEPGAMFTWALLMVCGTSSVFPYRRLRNS